MDFEDDTKQSFYGHFLEMQTALEAQIENLPGVDASVRPEAIDACLASIAQLSGVVKDASSYLPAYDQRSYSETIRDLSEKLAEMRRSLAPKQKFSFKNRKKDTSAGIGGAVKFSSTHSTEKPAAVSAVPEANNLVISQQSGKNLCPDPPAAASSFSSLLLSDIEGCVVLFPAGRTFFKSASVKGISRSLLFLGGAVNGPLHVTGLRDVTVVVACRQLRMHEAVNVDLYLLCTSRPIIEDCSGVRFAPLGKEGLGEAWEGVQRNMWDQVDDFKWLKSEHSPNWAVLPESERVSAERWEKVREMGLDEGLKAFVNKSTTL
ncbi:uncharacterized protein LAJ45_03198 [Morchella importuna]|uniref:TBCC-domain-containing protein n=1 Tax=Morchella conica CCBAS932 TaxID=1392247 RepID=A0A3N4KQZ7_9PEZI|nr:uncharacterized protein LAJ45_03198 [Morchella importuna]KAH8152971.1 hypothetical protein LAJ45_03198 [Morchella importuna]RPB12930.1 TBCC-domain-containing protein [Morchella conica CCBAS932]